MPNDILVIFADSTLGGTSRSALTAGETWVRAGHTVAFLPLREVPPSRLKQFSAIGRILRDLSEINPPSLVHFHHGAWSSRMRREAEQLLDEAIAVGWQVPMLTNNVFAVDDRVLSRWPGPRVTGLLGRWAQAQYLLGRHPGNRSPHAVVANAQDADRFRPATPDERSAARRRLGIGTNERVLLRVGSPLRSKWSNNYLRLARRLRHGERLLLVGAPPSLAATLSSSPHVSLCPPTSDDALLRDYYWASDVFLHDALRGETFGNVITEALLCGLPVVYRARRTRDNTPWEFRDVTGFTYAVTNRQWLGFSHDMPAPVADADVIRARYGLPAVSARLSALPGHLGDLPSGRHTVPVTQLPFILLRHNWLATMLKERRLRRH